MSHIVKKGLQVRREMARVSWTPNLAQMRLAETPSVGVRGRTTLRAQSNSLCEHCALSKVRCDNRSLAFVLTGRWLVISSSLLWNESRPSRFLLLGIDDLIFRSRCLFWFSLRILGSVLFCDSISQGSWSRKMRFHPEWPQPDGGWDPKWYENDCQSLLYFWTRVRIYHSPVLFWLTSNKSVESCCACGHQMHNKHNPYEKDNGRKCEQVRERKNLGSFVLSVVPFRTMLHWQKPFGQPNLFFKKAFCPVQRCPHHQSSSMWDRVTSWPEAFWLIWKSFDWSQKIWTTQKVRWFHRRHFCRGWEPCSQHFARDCRWLKNTWMCSRTARCFPFREHSTHTLRGMSRFWEWLQRLFWETQYARFRPTSSLNKDVFHPRTNRWQILFATQTLFSLSLLVCAQLLCARVWLAILGESLFGAEPEVLVKSQRNSLCNWSTKTASTFKALSRNVSAAYSKQNQLVKTFFAKICTAERHQNRWSLFSRKVSLRTTVHFSAA